MGGFGWQDILEDSGIFGKVAASNLVGGKPYSSCMDAHRAFYEALRIMHKKKTSIYLQRCLSSGKRIFACLRFAWHTSMPKEQGSRICMFRALRP